jgi:hypothetical protein
MNSSLSAYCPSRPKLPGLGPIRELPAFLEYLAYCHCNQLLGHEGPHRCNHTQWYDPAPARREVQDADVHSLAYQGWVNMVWGQR